MRTFSHRRGRYASIFSLTIGLLSVALPSPASAHVKWFAPYDVPGQPVLLRDVLSSQFFLLFGIALLALWLTCVVERTAIGTATMQVLDRIGKVARPRTEAMMRACTGGFFVALWAFGGIILTPELKTASAAISWFQVAMAAGMFWRPTTVLSALGIAVLYAIGVARYGIFHMLDYPIFLGLAAYLGLTAMERNVGRLRPVDIARWGAGITLLWASIEKWAYPEWTYPILHRYPDIAMGWNPHFYMTAAGVIEFFLAFGLLWTPLVRRLSAIVLTAMFVSAVFEFGKVDAVGHLMIVAILAAVLFDDSPPAKPTPSWWAPTLCCGVLAIYLLAYYGLHAALYGTSI